MWIRDSFSFRVVQKKLKKLGCTKIDNGNWWSHELRFSNYTKSEFTVVNHKSQKNMRMWTLRAMLKNAGIPEDDFKNA